MSMLLTLLFACLALFFLSRWVWTFHIRLILHHNRIEPDTVLKIKGYKNRHAHPAMWNVHTHSKDTLVLPSTVASCYHNCCTGGSIIPGNYGYHLVYWIYGTDNRKYRKLDLSLSSRMYPYALHVIMTSWLIFRNAWTPDYMIQCICVNSYHENISGLPSSCCVVFEMSLRAHHYQMLMWVIVSSLANRLILFSVFYQSRNHHASDVIDQDWWFRKTVKITSGFQWSVFSLCKNMTSLCILVPFSYTLTQVITPWIFFYVLPKTGSQVVQYVIVNSTLDDLL
jgi:hypothetical protein